MKTFAYVIQAWCLAAWFLTNVSLKSCKLEKITAKIEYEAVSTAKEFCVIFK